MDLITLYGLTEIVNEFFTRFTWEKAELGILIGICIGVLEIFAGRYKKA
jgi:hypothetical protein